MAQDGVPGPEDDLELPTCEQLAAGIRAFEANERRADAYYRALSQICDHWGDSANMASGIKILLDAWHLAFYRFGNFEPSHLTECVHHHLDILSQFRARSIATLSRNDHKNISGLFGQFLDALRGGKRRSPVAVAKALHLLAPDFFPLWDTDIALGYGSWWAFSEFGAMEYVPFCWKMRRLTEYFADCPCVRDAEPKRSMLKLIDEYNYSKFTKRWV